MPLLSILVPTYNRENYLRACLDSLLATTVDCEVLVSDNASTDGTQALLASYTDPRLRTFRQATNLGFLANHNFLLERASGRYLCIFGDDDMALPDCFESKVALLEAHPDVDMVYSLSVGMGPNGAPWPVSRPLGLPNTSYVGGRNEFHDLFFTCYIPWQSLVMRQAVYAAVGPLDPAWGLKAALDWYWLQKCVRGRKTAFLAERLISIRFHDGSHTVSQALSQGHFVEDKLAIWHKWLLEDDEPPYLSDSDWKIMLACLQQDARAAFGDSREQAALCVAALDKLRARCEQRSEDRVRAQLPKPDIFRPGTVPLPLDHTKQTIFLHHSNWTKSLWQHVVLAYARTFTPEDDVTLVLWLDPAQGVTAAQVGHQLELDLAKAGLAPDRWPDVLLVPDELDEAGLASLYAAADCLALPGDAQQVRHASRMRLPLMFELTPEAWRKVLPVPG